MDLAGLVLGSLILYLKGMRIIMFQLSGFYYRFMSSTRLLLLFFCLRVPSFKAKSRNKSTLLKVGLLRNLASRVPFKGVFKGSIIRILSLIGFPLTGSLWGSVRVPAKGA